MERWSAVPIIFPSPMRILVLGDLVRFFLRSGAGYPVCTDGGRVSRRGPSLAKGPAW